MPSLALSPLDAYVLLHFHSSFICLYLDGALSSPSQDQETAPASAPAARLRTHAAVVLFLPAEEAAPAMLALAPTVPSTIIPATTPTRKSPYFLYPSPCLSHTIVLSFPDNDGAAGYSPADNVDYTCGNTAITLTLCPGSTSDIPKRKRDMNGVKRSYPLSLN